MTDFRTSFSPKRPHNSVIFKRIVKNIKEAVGYNFPDHRIHANAASSIGLRVPTSQSYVLRSSSSLIQASRGNSLLDERVTMVEIEETKMESIDLFEIKRCWGNFAFDYVHSASVGKSGNWVSNGKLLLIISVYAPQEFSEKKLLWDYLGHVIDNWKGLVIIMGDFNEELADLEMIIDKGDASSDTLHKRAEVVKSIQKVDKLCATKASQKVKIKWAIEGDENSKYYHGILNKKRNQLSIRGVLVEGDWVENPNMVKNEFLYHFKNRFDKPKSVRLMLNMEFPHHLNSMQQLDLEAKVSNEEIKKAV
ncbi:RNA-directed DNA polymerase, eukaryota, reverse transcriptase zinc-binding domain protein [Tanacetum coccineum]